MIPIALAGLHFALFAVTATYVCTSADGQAAMLGIPWACVDAPVSALYLLPRSVWSVVQSIAPTGSLVQHLLYAPHVIHGVVGALWWYAMPRGVFALWERQQWRAQPPLKNP